MLATNTEDKKQKTAGSFQTGALAATDVTQWPGKGPETANGIDSQDSERLEGSHRNPNPNTS